MKKDRKNKRIEHRLFSDELNSPEEIRRSTSLSLWLPFLECLWNWSDFVTPHPMTVPVHREPELDGATHRRSVSRCSERAAMDLRSSVGETLPHLLFSILALQPSGL